MSGNPIVIVGGGIGGLSAALALARLGQPSLLLEQAEAFKEVGAGIQVGPNGYRALTTLGLAEQADALAVFPDDLMMMDSVSGEEITRIPTGQPFRDRFGYPYALIHRADLHKVLLDACISSDMVNMRVATKVASFAEHAAGVDVLTSNGERIAGCALIGADGLWSATRQAIVGDGPPRVSGHIAYRAVLPASDVPERYRRNAMILWGGPKHHLVQYPLRTGKLFNLVAVFHSDAYFEGWDTKGDPEELHRRFAGSCEPVQELLSRIDSWRMWVLCDREPTKEWSKGRVTLLGDAAHPMLQYLAQGACMAIEDGIVLANEIASSPQDPAAAFGRYQQRRYLRAGRCQVMARVHGELYHASGVTAELRNGMLRSRTAQQSYDGLAWLYDAVL